MFADLKHKMSPARRAEIARAAKAELRLEDEAYQMSLRAVREMAGKTQAEVATAMKMGQGTCRCSRRATIAGSPTSVATSRLSAAS